MNNPLVLFKSFSLSVAMAVALACTSTSARADALPIGPSVGTFTPAPELMEMWPSFASSLGSLVPGMSVSDTGLTVPVAEVTVDGQGPGPVRISFGPGVSGQWDTPEWSMIASDVAFDVGSKSLTLDLTVRIYNTCTSSGADVCAAWYSVDHQLNDLPVLSALTVTGAIDGNMALDQAVVLQTLVPQSLTLSADLYVNFDGMNQVMGVLFPLEPMMVTDEEMPQVYFGNLTVTPVPELSTSGMLAMGMVGLAALARRRRASS